MTYPCTAHAYAHASAQESTTPALVSHKCSGCPAALTAAAALSPSLPVEDPSASAVRRVRETHLADGASGVGEVVRRGCGGRRGGDSRSRYSLLGIGGRRRGRGR